MGALFTFAATAGTVNTVTATTSIEHHERDLTTIIERHERDLTISIERYSRATTTISTKRHGCATATTEPITTTPTQIVRVFG